MWNVNTVLMGGLGGDPDAFGSSSEEGLLYPKGLVVHVVMYIHNAEKLTGYEFLEIC